MSKKKKNKSFTASLQKLEKTISELIEHYDLTKEELKEFFAMMNAMGTGELMTKLYYNYNKPDYSKCLHQLHPALERLMKIEKPIELIESCREAQNQLIDEGADAGAELKNAIYWILANQNSFYGHNKSNLPLFCILCIMTEMQVTDATDVMLELLHQDGKFFEFFFNAFEGDMAEVMSCLCINDLDKLESFMYEVGRIPTSKCITADAVIQMAVTNPALRLRVITWFAKVLKRYSEIRVVESNIDHIVHSLALLRPKELEKLILQLYNEKDIPFIEVEDMDHVHELIEKGTDERIFEYDSLYEMLETIENNYVDGIVPEDYNFDSYDGYDDDYDDYDDDDYDYDDDDFDDDYYDDYDDDEDDDDSFCVIDQFDNKLFRLEVTLDNSPVDVKREIIVPSNIRLSHLAEVLAIAMGWRGYSLSQFIKKNKYYSSLEDFDDTLELWDRQEPFDMYALNELLNRKGSNIKWEYDFDDSWVHTIRLIEKIDFYEGDSLELTKAIGACPPDDCGGVSGYAEMLEILKDKKHPKYREYKRFIKSKFDPQKVDLKSIKRKMANYYERNI